jgi:hypothetical protein
MLAEAEAELAAVIARRELTADAGDISLQLARGWHAQVLLDLGRFEEAEREWRRLSADGQRLLGPGHPDLLSAREHEALALDKLGRFQEAAAPLADVIAKRPQRRAAIALMRCGLARRTPWSWSPWDATTSPRPRGAGRIEGARAGDRSR